MNNGKILEIFVRRVEEALLPRGITVTPNKKLYNEKGIQIAEFDIHIEGKIGTTSLKWLIECRDRPSEGPAPGAWIEQLAGRKSRFDYSKVIAVSTTGFAPGAMECAEDEGIELRTVTEVNVDSIKDWLLIEEMDIFKQGSELLNAVFEISSDESPDMFAALKKRIDERKEPILISTENDKPVETRMAFYAVLKDNPQLYADLIPDGGSKTVRIAASYPKDDSHFVVQTELGKVRIRKILFHGNISVTKGKAPLSEIQNYTNISTNEHISTSASFAFEMQGQQYKLSFEKIGIDGDTHVLISKA